LSADNRRSALTSRPTGLEKYFPGVPERELLSSQAPWPALNGTLAILFTPRSGSTLLSREIGRRYRIGEIRESLNPQQILSRAKRIGSESPASILRDSIRTLGEDGWFAFKAGGDALAIAERSGLIEAYLPGLRFILLRRRDLVAQAVSIVKAEITGRFHSPQTETRPAQLSDYSRDEILTKMRIMLHGVRRLDAYARSAGCPFQIAFYEDFETGDFMSIVEICDALRLPAAIRLPMKRDGKSKRSAII
jgi:LPS sulfotransferase NodH